MVFISSCFAILYDILKSTAKLLIIHEICKQKKKKTTFFPENLHKLEKSCNLAVYFGVFLGTIGSRREMRGAVLELSQTI